MNPLLRSSAAHVFVGSLDAPALSPEDEHHLVRVLRLRDGDAVSASDGAGRWRPCELRGGALVATGQVETEPAHPHLTIAVAIPKGDRLDWMVQKLTELGVDEIVLLHCARSVVRWEGERAGKALARLDRIAREAAMQSRRTTLPVILGPVPVAQLWSHHDVVAAEPGGDPLASAGCVVVGPEGGFAPDEVPSSVRRVGLASTMLRVETAAVAAAARLATDRGETDGA